MILSEKEVPSFNLFKPMFLHNILEVLKLLMARKIKIMLIIKINYHTQLGRYTFEH